jgi:hypothetical protein
MCPDKTVSNLGGFGSTLVLTGTASSTSTKVITSSVSNTNSSRGSGGGSSSSRLAVVVEALAVEVPWYYHRISNCEVILLLRCRVS